MARPIAGFGPLEMACPPQAMPSSFAIGPLTMANGKMPDELPMLFRLQRSSPSASTAATSSGMCAGAHPAITALAATVHGVAVLAEGLIEKLDPGDFQDLLDVELDDHGHIRFAEIDLARKVKVELEGRFKQRGIRLTISNKNIGYELRCCDPIPFDMAYCRELGNAAIRFLLGGGNGAMVSIQNGRMVPLLFDEIRDHNTGKTRVRNVDPTSENYRVAREYMLRLNYKDFENPEWTEKLAQAGNLSVEELKRRFA